jgi:hypothetical protein
MWVVRCVITKNSKKIHSDYTTDYLRETELKATIVL